MYPAICKEADDQPIGLRDSACVPYSCDTVETRWRWTGRWAKPFAYDRPMDTQPIPHARILRVEIVGGFFPRVVYELADGLNVLIGEKGSGKSTTLDILRYGLGCEGDWSEDAASRVATNLGGGTVTVTFETRGGVTYVLSRKWTEEKDRQPPTVLTSEGRPAHVPIETFRVEAFAHNEIERYAQSPAAQLALVDRAIAEALAPIRGRIAELERELGRNKLEVLRLEEEVRHLENQAMNAESIEAELARLAKADGPDAEAIERAHAERGLREREVFAMGTVASTLATTRDEVNSLLAGARRAFSLLLEEEEALRGGSNGDLFAPLSDSLRRTLDSLEEMGARFATEADALAGTLRCQQGELGARHVRQENEYALLLSTHGEHSSRALERIRQQQRYAEMAGAARVLALRRAELEDATRARDSLAGELSELRRTRSEARARGVERLNAVIGPNVRFTLQEAGANKEYAELLFEALKPVCSKRDLAQKLSASIPPEELFDLVVAGDYERLVRNASERPKRAEQSVKALRENRSALLELQAIDTDDLARVEVQHGTVFKELAKSSAGQKAGALLPILLLVDSSPLLIDQPEDNVGAKFFSGPGAEMILARKNERQTIFATYNSNLIVCAKADKVFGLACPDGLQGTVFGQGTRRQMVDPMLEFLEGGREAFNARRSFYEGREES